MTKNPNSQQCRSVAWPQIVLQVTGLISRTHPMFLQTGIGFLKCVTKLFGHQSDSVLGTKQKVWHRLSLCVRMSKMSAVESHVLGPVIRLKTKLCDLGISAVQFSCPGSRLLAHLHNFCFTQPVIGCCAHSSDWSLTFKKSLFFSYLCRETFCWARKQFFTHTWELTITMVYFFGLSGEPFF